MKNLIVIMIFTLVSSTAFARPQTVTLAVPTMSCVTCPLTVKIALKQVSGVDDAKVNFNTKQAVVVFDDKKATINDLIAATTNAGYPSTLIAQEYSK
tara:strand:- start:3295 stop:3585 length:291 start_codon:yes stop_codon:yes gene_type:complete